MTIYTLVGIVGLFTAVAVPAVLLGQHVRGRRRINAELAALEREEAQP